MTEIKSGRGRVASFEYVAPEEKQMFSKGPWRWDEDISGDKIGISDEGGRDVLYVNHSEGVSVPREKDAHLIAAAPELYEALRMLVKIVDDGFELHSLSTATLMSKETLAQARGES